jgi:hypothetical protein
MRMRDVVRLTLVYMVIPQLLIVPGTWAAPADPVDHGRLQVQGRRFVFEDGTPFIPLAISFGGIEFLTRYDDFAATWDMTPDYFFDELAAHGINCVYAHTNRCQGWRYPEFSQSDADLIDNNLTWMLDKFQSKGMYHFVLLSHHDEFREIPWESNLYSSINGGPCDRIDAFITNAQAKEKFKERIDYFNNHASNRAFAGWQLGAEWALGNGDFDSQSSIDWHLEMAQYIRSVDTRELPISTTYHWQDARSVVPEDQRWGWYGGDVGCEHLYANTYNQDVFDHINLHSYRLEPTFQLDQFWSFGKPIISSEAQSRFTISGETPSFVSGWKEHLQWAIFSYLALWSSGADWSLWDVTGGDETTDSDLMNNFSEYCDVFEAASNFVNNALIPDFNGWDDNPSLWGDNISGNGRIYSTGDGSRVMAFIWDNNGSYDITGLQDNDYTAEWYSIHTGELIETEQLSGTSITVNSPNESGGVMLYVYGDEITAGHNHKKQSQDFNFSSLYSGSSVTFHFSLNRPDVVDIKIKDLCGRTVYGKTGMRGRKGRNNCLMHAARIPAGAYMVTVKGRHHDFKREWVLNRSN